MEQFVVTALLFAPLYLIAQDVFSRQPATTAWRKDMVTPRLIFQPEPHSLKNLLDKGSSL
jgi:hypothetical protein